MIRILFAVLALVFLGSCSTTKPLSMKPVDAKIPELTFYYWKDNSWRLVRGHGGEYFQPGDPKKFKVKVHKDSGKCLINYQDGDAHTVYNCKGQSEVEFDLGNYSITTPEVFGMSVATEDLGIQVGYFYPNVHPQRAVLGVDYKCPYQNTNGNISVCTRPASYKFVVMALLSNPGPGKLQFVRACSGQPTQTTVIDVSGPGAQQVELVNDYPGYCIMSLNYRNVLPDGSMGEVREQQIIHIRFYNPEYIPLSVPSVIEWQSGYKVCSGEAYEKVSLNGSDRGGMGFGKCLESKSAQLSFLAWDSIGRLAWAARSKSALIGLMDSSFTLQTNGFDFYQNLIAWMREQMKHCKTNMACLQREKTRLLKHPKVVEAMTAWDSSLLFK